MIRDGKVIFGRIALKALNGALSKALNQNMVDGRFEGLIPIVLLVAPRKAIMITDRFVYILGGNIVRVTEAARKKVL